MREGLFYLELRKGSVLTSNKKKKQTQKQKKTKTKNKVITAAAQEGSDGKIMLIHRGGGEFQAQKVMKF